MLLKMKSARGRAGGAGVLFSSGEGGLTLGVGEGWLEGTGWEGKGSRATGRRRVLGVGCRFAPRLHRSLAASHLSISLPACMPRDDKREALAQGPGIWQPLEHASPRLASVLETCPAVGASPGCQASRRALCTLTSLNLTPPARRAGFAILSVTEA